MKIAWRNLPPTGLALWLLLAVLPASAQGKPGQAAPPANSASATELTRLEQMIQELKREIEELKKKAETPVPSSISGLEERTRALEEAVEKMKTELESTTEESQSTSDELAALSAIEERRTNVTLYGTFNIDDFDGEGSVFDAEAIELVFSARPHPKFSVFAEIEFEQAAAVGGGRGGEVEVEQAHVTYEFSPLLGFRAGVVLVPFGKYNLEHFAPNRDTVSAPLAATVVVPGDWADNGLGFLGRGTLGAGWALSYEAYTLSGLDGDVSPAGTRAGRQSFGTDNNSNKAVVGRLAVEHLDNFELGVSGYQSKYDNNSRLGFDGMALDLSGSAGPVHFTGDYYRMMAEQPAGPDLDLSGYFARLSLDVARRLLRSGWHGRHFPEAKLTLMAQLEEVEIERGLGAGALYRQEERTTFGLSYRPSHQYVIKVNYEDGEAKDVPVVNGDRKGWVGSVAFVF